MRWNSCTSGSADGIGKAREPVFVVLGDADADKHRHWQADFAAVDDGHAVLDKAFLFQSAQAFPARRGGQADLLAELGDGQGAVALQGVEDGVIVAVKLIHSNNSKESMKHLHIRH
jgi:hypothetical protein